MLTLCRAEHYPKIINQKQFDRLTGLLEGQKVLLGGVTNERMQIAPTLLDDVDPASPVMNAEIFGPILPVMTYEDIDEVIDFVTEREKPLALYLFTGDAAVEKKILNAISFGGGCINDTLVHVAHLQNGLRRCRSKRHGALSWQIQFRNIQPYQKHRQEPHLD